LTLPAWLARRLRGGRRHPPLPPEDLLAGIGPGDFWKVGYDTVELIDRLLGIQRDALVLDVGCGLGRIAWPLRPHLGRRARYAGLDAERQYVDWCATHLGLPGARFTFHHADVRSSYVNSAGRQAPETFVFPWPGESFTLAIAISLFTHLLPTAAYHYLSEIARTLRPGGHFFGSFFLADEAGLAAIRSGKTYPTFNAPIVHGWVHDAAAPEDAVAHDPGWLQERCHDVGLRILETHAGKWKTSTDLYYQDLVVAVRER
jgi:SAM-dependent methyltransferase